MLSTLHTSSSESLRCLGVARVLLDHPAQSDLELTLKEGDIITNIDKKEKSWWEGELHGRRGRFSRLLVKEIEKNAGKPSGSSGR